MVLNWFIPTLLFCLLWEGQGQDQFTQNAANVLAQGIFRENVEPGWGGKVPETARLRTELNELDSAGIARDEEEVAADEETTNDIGQFEDETDILNAIYEPSPEISLAPASDYRQLSEPSYDAELAYSPPSEPAYGSEPVYATQTEPNYKPAFTNFGANKPAYSPSIIPTLPERQPNPVYNPARELGYSAEPAYNPSSQITYETEPVYVPQTEPNYKPVFTNFEEPNPTLYHSSPETVQAAGPAYNPSPELIYSAKPAYAPQIDPNYKPAFTNFGAFKPTQPVGQSNPVLAAEPVYNPLSEPAYVSKPAYIPQTEPNYQPAFTNFGEPKPATTYHQPSSPYNQQISNYHPTNPQLLQLTPEHYQPQASYQEPLPSYPQHEPFINFGRKR